MVLFKKYAPTLSKNMDGDVTLYFHDINGIINKIL